MQTTRRGQRKFVDSAARDRAPVPAQFLPTIWGNFCPRLWAGFYKESGQRLRSLLSQSHNGLKAKFAGAKVKSKVKADPFWVFTFDFTLDFTLYALFALVGAGF